jgi:hypothetical protein
VGTPGIVQGTVSDILALTKTVEIVDAVLVIFILVLAILIIVQVRKRKAPAKASGVPAQPNYYADVQQQAAAAGPMGQPDPFAGFGAPQAPQQMAPPPAAPAPVMTPPPPPPPPPPAPAAPSMPAPGTPAGWMPDPSGDPNTLRYWDGAAWTQHIAQRN